MTKAKSKGNMTLESGDKKVTMPVEAFDKILSAKPVRGQMGKLTVPKPPRICIEVEVGFAPELIGLLHEFKQRMIGIGYDETQYLPGMEALGKVMKEDAKGESASIILAFPDTPEVMAELQELKIANKRTIWLHPTDVSLPGEKSGSECDDNQMDLTEGEGDDMEDGEE